MMRHAGAQVALVAGLVAFFVGLGDVASPLIESTIRAFPINAAVEEVVDAAQEVVAS